MELHLLLQHLFFDTALHSAHARVSHFITILVPQLVRLFIACVWVEGAAERKLQTYSSLFGPFTLGRLSCNQIVQLLKECQIGSLIVVKIKAQVSTDLSKTFLTGQDSLMPQQVLSLILLDLLVSLHIVGRGLWVGEG